MAHDIIVRFPNEKIANEFCAQMSDGFGENLCDFNVWHQKDGTSGDKYEDFERVHEDGKLVCFVNEIFDE